MFDNQKVKIKDENDQDNFAKNFNYLLPIGASYKLINLSKSGYLPTMQSESDSPILLKIYILNWHKNLMIIK